MEGDKKATNINAINAAEHQESDATLAAGMISNGWTQNGNSWRMIIEHAVAMPRNPIGKLIFRNVYDAATNVLIEGLKVGPIYKTIADQQETQDSEGCQSGNGSSAGSADREEVGGRANEPGQRQSIPRTGRKIELPGRGPA